MHDKSLHELKGNGFLWQGSKGLSHTREYWWTGLCKKNIV